MRASPHLNVILAAAIFGSSGLFIKILGLPVFTFAFFRMAMPVLILGLYFLYKKNLFFKKISTIMLAASALNALRMAFYFYGFDNTTIGNAIIILYTWPLFAAVFGALFIKEKITVRLIISLPVAFCGIALVYLDRDTSFSGNDFIGISSVLLSSILFALSMVIYKKESPSYSKSETVFIQNIAGALVYFPLFLRESMPSFNEAVWAIIYGVLIGLVGYLLFFSALKKIKASTASAMAYFEVISAIALGVVFLGEKITWSMAAGGLMILVPAILLRREN